MIERSFSRSVSGTHFWAAKTALGNRLPVDVLPNESLNKLRVAMSGLEPPTQGL